MNDLILNEANRKYFSLTSYLSPDVQKLIEPAFNDQLCDSQTELLWTNQAECLLNINYLNERVIVKDENEEIDYLLSSRHVSPYLEAIRLNLVANFDLERHASRFLGSELELFRSHVLHAHNKTQSHLILYSVFERCLGNLFHSLNRSQVPFLLRDLLNEISLEIFLGKEITDFLKLLLCGPKSLNLRNLAWHGFLNPDQYSDKLAFLLIALIILIDTKLVGFTVTERKKFTLTVLRPSKINVNTFDHIEKDFTEVINRSILIDDTRRDLWRDAVLNSNMTNLARMVILLPEIEHILRKVYSCVNQIEDNSSQIAFTNEFYLTIDDLLASSELISRLDPLLVVLLLDMFNYVDGPRIRDRVSHGDIDLASTDTERYYSNVLVFIAISLASGSNVQSNMAYEPNFHPLAVLKQDLFELIDENNELLNFK